MKKLLVLSITLLLIGATGIYLYRYEIIQRTAQTMLVKMLPEYLKTGSIVFNVRGNTIEAKGLSIANPAGFSRDPILWIGDLTCIYKLKGKTLLEGVEIISLKAASFVLKIERSRDGRINIYEMKDLFASPQKQPQPGPPSPGHSMARALIGPKKPSELIKLPDVVHISDGSVTFVDSAASTDSPYTLTFDNVRAEVSLRLNEDYSKVFYVTSRGSANVNGRQDESIQWVISLNPTTPMLTMSNRFKVARVRIVPFQPYFTQHSPFVFRSGRFSGDMVFDFDNGRIGSTNTVWLEDLSFAVKQGYENAEFWQTTVPDLIKYLTSVEPGSAAIVFDFKLKGEMSRPNFFLGPIAKRAVASMAVDKISDAVTQFVSKGDGSGPDLEKVKEIADFVQGLIKK